MSLRNRCCCLLLMAVGIAPLAFAQAPPPPNPLAPLGAVPVPVENPQSEARIALGQALFWDEQLSLTGTVACGTCHAPAAGGGDPRSRQQGFGNVHPGADGEFGTADDIVGSAGVPQHDGEGRYLHSASFGMAPQAGARQAPSAINAGYFQNLFWDGRAAAALVDAQSGQTLIASGAALENQALGPLVNAAEMSHVGGTLLDMQARIAGLRPLRLASSIPAALRSWIAGRSYPQLFEEAFGSAEVSASAIAMAIASYERSLVADQTPLDAELRGTPSLTALERQGRRVFATAGCGGCHGGALLSDDNFHYIGVRPAEADVGRRGVTGRIADQGRMRTPSLRNVALSAPYMADGRLATLSEVVAFYNRGGDFDAANKAPPIQPLGLSEADQAALVAFLGRPLTDPRLAAGSGPFERPGLYSESSRVPQSTGLPVADATGRLPRLIAIEPPLAGEGGFTVAVDSARPGAQARVLVDLLAPAAPDAPALLAEEFTLGGEGSASVELILPDDVELADTDLYVRVFVDDPDSESGWSASAAARFRLLGVSAIVFGHGFEN